MLLSYPLVKVLPPLYHTGICCQAPMMPPIVTTIGSIYEPTYALTASSDSSWRSNSASKDSFSSCNPPISTLPPFRDTLVASIILMLNLLIFSIVFSIVVKPPATDGRYASIVADRQTPSSVVIHIYMLKDLSSYYPLGGGIPGTSVEASV